jgi:uncharacterized membrane protein YcgQ (UPF0703/DUF1980 family)
MGNLMIYSSLSLYFSLSLSLSLSVSLSLSLSHTHTHKHTHTHTHHFTVLGTPLFGFCRGYVFKVAGVTVMIWPCSGEVRFQRPVEGMRKAAWSAQVLPPSRQGQEGSAEAKPGVSTDRI